MGEGLAQMNINIQLTNKIDIMNKMNSNKHKCIKSKGEMQFIKQKSQMIEIEVCYRC